MNEDIKQLIQELKKAGVETKVFEDALNAAGTNTQKLQELFKTLSTTVRNLRSEAKGLSGEFGEMRENLSAALAEMVKTQSVVKKAVNAYKGLSGIVTQLAQEEEGIYEFSLKQLQSHDKKAKLAFAEMRTNAIRIEQEKGLAGLSDEEFEKQIMHLKINKELSASEEAILRAKRSGFIIEKEALKSIEARRIKEEQVKNSVGLTGSALEGVAGILGKMGFGSLSSEIADITKAIETDMRKAIEQNKTIEVSATFTGKGAEEVVKIYQENQNLIDSNDKQIQQLQEKGELSEEEESILRKLVQEKQKAENTNRDLIEQGKVVVETTYEELSLREKINGLAKGLSKTMDTVAKKLKDPAVLFSFITKSLFKASEHTAKLQKSLGISYSAANGLKNEMNGVALASGSNFITADKLVKTFAALTQEIGMSASVLGNEALIEATYLTEKLHMSAGEAAQLVSMAALQGKSAKNVNKELGKQLSTFNKQNKTMFSLKDIMSDVANASKATVLTLGKSPQKIAAAAAEARKLGTNLAGVEKIADSLLDFESSIEKEMEAQLITGKNLNLARAREAALVGDLETVAKEVGKQEAIREAFATNNVIAQKAAADALGISREELAKMTYQQELARLGAENFKKEYGEVAYENLKAQSAQDKFNDLLTKVQDILANVLSAFSPIIDAVAWLASKPFVAPILAAGVAVKALGGSFGGVIKSAGALYGSLGKVKDKIIEAFASKNLGGFSDALGGVKDKAKAAGQKIIGTFQEGKDKGVTGMVKDKISGSGDKAKEALSSTGDKTKDLSDKTKNVKPGKGLKQLLTNLGDGLRSLGNKFGDVLRGIAALGLASIAIVGPLAGAMLIIKDVPATAMLAFAASIGVLGGSLALVGKQASNVMKGGIALAAVGVGILAAATGFSLLDGVDPASVIAVTGSLVTLGIAAALLGSLAGNIMTGALAIGVLGLAMVPAAFALSLLEGVNVSSIIAFSVALPLLGLAAAGLGFLAPFIMAGAGALAVLGAAMIPAAVAFNIMAKADLEKISKGLTAIGAVGPQLALAGAGMIGLAAGAGILALASPGLILASGALALLGIASNLVAKANLENISKGLTAIGSVGPQLALAGAGMVYLAAGAGILALASPALILASGALTLLGIASNLVANANFENIANQLTQLGGIGPGLVTAAGGLFAIAGGLTAFAFAMAGASAISGLTSLLGGGIMGDLEALAAMSEPLAQVGISLTQIAAGLSGIALALSTLETAKLDELKDLVITTAFAAPMVAATGAITDLISGLSGGGKDENSGNAELVAKIDELIAAVKEGGDVYIDGNKAGESLMLASVKSS